MNTTPTTDTPRHRQKSVRDSEGWWCECPYHAELRQVEERLAEIERDARWIVGQYQRLKDEPVKEVALSIVRLAAGTKEPR